MPYYRSVKIIALIIYNIQNIKYNLQIMYMLQLWSGTNDSDLTEF